MACSQPLRALALVLGVGLPVLEARLALAQGALAWVLDLGALESRACQRAVARIQMGLELVWGNCWGNCSASWRSFQLEVAMA